jgi:hypothetical protein
MASLAHKVLTAGTLANPSRINQLINATQQSLVLDDGFDVLDFATRIQGLAAGNVVFETVPVLGDGTSESDGAVLNVDPDAVRAFVGQAIDVPSRSDSNPDFQPAPQAKPTLTVDVFNASAVRGLAKSVSDQLTGQGFQPGTVGNSAVRPTSVVRYPTGGQDFARTVAYALGGLPVEEDAQLATGTVHVYLGKDYPKRSKSRVAGELPRRIVTPAVSDVARPVADTAGADSTTIASSPPPAPPPRPSMVGGKVPCVS